jgi:phosphatidate cytidylyltransferase
MNTLPQSFLPRLLSTVFLWGALVVAYILRSEPGFALLICIPALGALWEYFALLESGKIAHHRGIGMGAALALVVLNFYFLREGSLGLVQTLASESLFFAALTIFLFLREYGRNNPGRATVEAIAFTLLGVVYIPWLFLFVAKLLYLTPRSPDGHTTGQYLVLFVIAVTKFTDVGAFLCGSLFGRTPFFPNISPKKTAEGIIGALVVAVLVGLAVFRFFGTHLPAWSVGMICGVSLLLGVAGIAGDLAESLLKRSVHSKDSGHALPGIGGCLDLIDSLLFTLPVFYFLLLFVLRP